MSRVIPALILLVLGASTSSAQTAGAQVTAARSGVTCGGASEKTVRCSETVNVTADDLREALRPLSSAVIDSSDLALAGPDLAAQLDFARQLAGGLVGAERIYVEGMPAAVPPPATAVSRILVNADPVSAEFSGVDEIRIDIEMKPLDRRWRFSASLPSFSGGGGSPLASSGQPVTRGESVAISGPLPWRPLTFSLSTSRFDESRQPVFVSRMADGMTTDPGFRSGIRSDNLTAVAAYTSARVIFRATWTQAGAASSHAGAGGVNDPSTAIDTDSSNKTFQATWRIRDGSRVHRGGIVLYADRLAANADSPAAASVVTAQLRSGGSEVASDARRTATMTLKHVVEQLGTSCPWEAGIQIDQATVNDVRTLNPLGRLQFESMNASTATWIVTSGVESGSVTANDVAVFAEKTMMNTPRALVRTGLRFDWQHHDGLFVQPRIAAATRVAGFQVTGSAGLFIKAWTPDLFVSAAESDGTRATTRVFHEVQPQSIAQLELGAGERLRSTLDPAFSRRHDVVLRAGVHRPIRWLQSGVEHTWTLSDSLPGMVRLRGNDGLVDHIASHRRLRRHQTDARISTRWHGQSVTTYYTYTRSFDDADTPGLTPSLSQDGSDQWGPTNGIARHAAGMAATVTLPLRIRVSTLIGARAGFPYNVVTGRDVAGLATFADRGGLPRNSEVLPVSRTASVYAMRSVRLKRLPWTGVDVGVRADNITNRINVTAVGRVIGTPLFGVPIGAAPGRSIRVWITAGR
jgi:hypothetical protein